MAIGMLLEMAASADPDRVLVGSRSDGLSAHRLQSFAELGAAEIRRRGAGHVAFVGVNAPVVPLTVLAGGLAGVPVVPLNYRLSTDALRGLLSRLDAPLVVADERFLGTVGEPAHAVGVLSTDDWIRLAENGEPAGLPDVDDAATAVMLFTSGTTSTPKGVLLRHSHLVSYVLQTVEFASAAPEDAALISVPPYHVAGIGTVLTNLYSGRRMAYLADFTAEEWLASVNREAITGATLVPTMLSRIVEHLDGAVADVPSLRSIAYGGARLPAPVLRRALAAFPEVGFTNAYGLTETSSTIAVLDPDDHRAAEASEDPAVRARLGSAGRFVPGIEGQIRDADGTELGPGQAGELWVRGPQVSGEYAGAGSSLDDDGWFPTRDRAHLDADGYLFIDGRADDTIIRGGENIAPAEIEDVLSDHPDVADAAVFGAPDEQWGDRIVAALVLRSESGADPDGADLPAAEPYRDWVRARLRSSRTPDQILFLPELPYTATGKLLVRELITLATDQ